MDSNRDPALLTHSARQSHIALVANVERHHGIQVRSAHMARNPWTQARLWRQSRTRERVEQAYRQLEHLGMVWLRAVLEDVGPQRTGPWLTNALPGQGWHQWGEAIDYFILNPDGSANWDGNHRGYLVLGEEAARLGLTAGYFWKHRDPGHIQMRRERVRDVYTPSQIDQLMKERWKFFSGRS